MLSVRLLVNTRLLVVKFGGSQSYAQIFYYKSGGTPNRCIVQGSTVVIIFIFVGGVMWDSKKHGSSSDSPEYKGSENQSVPPDYPTWKYQHNLSGIYKKRTVESSYRARWYPSIEKKKKLTMIPERMLLVNTFGLIPWLSIRLF